MERILVLGVIIVAASVVIGLIIGSLPTQGGLIVESCNITILTLPNGTSYLIGVLLARGMLTPQYVVKAPHGLVYYGPMPNWLNVSLSNTAIYWTSARWNGYYVYVFGTVAGTGGTVLPPGLANASRIWACNIYHIHGGLDSSYIGVEYASYAFSMVINGYPMQCYPLVSTIGFWAGRIPYNSSCQVP